MTRLNTQSSLGQLDAQIWRSVSVLSCLAGWDLAHRGQALLELHFATRSVNRGFPTWNWHVLIEDPPPAPRTQECFVAAN